MIVIVIKFLQIDNILKQKHKDGFRQNLYYNDWVFALCLECPPHHFIYFGGHSKEIEKFNHYNIDCYV